jgi:cell division protein FtsW (lipid II flippase)
LGDFVNKKDREQFKELNDRLNNFEETIKTKSKRIEFRFKNQYRESVRQVGYALAGILASYAALFTVLYLDPEKSANEWIVIIVVSIYMAIVIIIIVRERRIGNKNLREWFEEEK